MADEDLPQYDSDSDKVRAPPDGHARVEQQGLCLLSAEQRRSQRRGPAGASVWSAEASSGCGAIGESAFELGSLTSHGASPRPMG